MYVRPGLPVCSGQSTPGSHVQGPGSGVVSYAAHCSFTQIVPVSVPGWPWLSSVRHPATRC
jgi:hypothetical protein